MYRHILKIGNARYTFNQAALCTFIAEAKLRERGEAACAPLAEGALQEASEITSLYRTYRSTDSVDALVQLKTRLEQVSVAYGSHALAEEVLSINSCLPYERRVSFN